MKIDRWNTQQIEIHSLSQTVGAYGPTETYALARKIEGRICEFSGQEQFRNGGVFADATHILYCDRDVTITDTDRIKYNSTYYTVKHLQDDELIRERIGDRIIPLELVNE